MTFDQSPADAGLLTLYVSHDHALTELQDFGACNPHLPQHLHLHLHLEIRLTGSLDAIRTLNESHCLLAGFHTQPFADADSRAARTYRPLLKPGLHKIIGCPPRSHGPIVAPRNPLPLRSLGDVARTRARFVNRALGTGTRLLPEELLAQNRYPSNTWSASTARKTPMQLWRKLWRKLWHKRYAGHQPNHPGEMAAMKRLLLWWK